MSPVRKHFWQEVGARESRVAETEKLAFELIHPCGREHHGLVVRDQDVAGFADAALGDEEIEIGFADFVGGHRLFKSAWVVWGFHFLPRFVAGTLSMIRAGARRENGRDRRRRFVFFKKNRTGADDPATLFQVMGLLDGLGEPG